MKSFLNQMFLSCFLNQLSLQVFISQRRGLRLTQCAVTFWKALFIIYTAMYGTCLAVGVTDDSFFQRKTWTLIEKLVEKKPLKTQVLNQAVCVRSFIVAVHIPSRIKRSNFYESLWIMLSSDIKYRGGHQWCGQLFFPKKNMPKSGNFQKTSLFFSTVIFFSSHRCELCSRECISSLSSLHQHNESCIAGNAWIIDGNVLCLCVCVWSFACKYLELDVFGLSRVTDLLSGVVGSFTVVCLCASLICVCLPPHCHTTGPEILSVWLCVCMSGSVCHGSTVRLFLFFSVVFFMRPTYTHWS